MSKEQEKPWIDSKGQPISFKDCKDAAHHAISVMEKELRTSGTMQKSDSMYFFYQRQIRVMEVMREKFDMLHKHAQKVQRKTVKKRKKLIH